LSTITPAKLNSRSHGHDVVGTHNSLVACRAICWDLMPNAAYKTAANQIPTAPAFQL